MTAERVCLLTPLAGRDGGVAIHVMESAAALSAAGHNVTVICARADAPAAHRVVEVPALAEPAAAGPEFARALRAARPDVVHVHDLAEPAVVAAAQRCAPTIIGAHGYPGCLHNNHYFSPGVECHRAHGAGCLANIALRGCYHARDPRPLPGLYRQTKRRLAAYAMADGIVAYSNAVVGHLAENGLQARLVALFTPLADRNDAPMRVADGGRRVLFVGRVVPAKGLDTLLHAIARTGAQLTVAGDGWSRPAAENLARTLGIEGRVRFAGWMSGEALVAAYRECHVVALPSLWPEPFGLVGLEAMALGRPVVASWTGGVRDWLEHGMTGLGVRPGDVGELADALARVLDDARLQVSMGTAGRRVLEQRFSVAAHLAALRSAFAAAAQRSEARRASA